MFIGLDFSPLRGGFIKPPALWVVGDYKQIKCLNRGFAVTKNCNALIVFLFYTLILIVDIAHQ